MDIKKIGAFLKELRKENDLTQEQLAEKINVAARTVSRWETGHNMPDLMILSELAEFYEVSLGEILDGERKSECMQEEKEIVSKIVEYSEIEKSYLNKVEYNTLSIMWIGAVVILLVEPFITQNRMAYVDVMILLLCGVTYFLGASVWYGLCTTKILDVIIHNKKLIISMVIMFSLLSIVNICLLKQENGNITSIIIVKTILTDIVSNGALVVGFILLFCLSDKRKRMMKRNNNED